MKKITGLMFVMATLWVVQPDEGIVSPALAGEGTPSYDFAFRCGAGESREDVYVYADPHRAAHFFYVSALFFKEDSEMRKLHTLFVPAKRGLKTLVHFFLVRNETKLMECMKRKGSEFAGQSLSDSAFEPMPVRVLKVRLRFPEILPFSVVYQNPDVIDSDNEFAAIGAKVDVPILIDTKYLPEFTQALDDGLDFVIKQAFSFSQTGQTALSGETKVEVSSTNERKFFGDRSKVWASADQVATLFLNSTIQNDWHAIIEDDRLVMPVMTLIEGFLSQAQSSARALGELSTGFISKYAIARDDELFRLDGTTHVSNQMCETLQRLNALAQAYEEYSKGSGGGSVSVLFGLFGGGGGGSSENSHGSASKSIQQFLNEKCSSNEWEGKETNPLNIRMYEVDKVALNQYTKTQIDIVMRKTPGIFTVSFDRNTARHLWERPADEEE